MSKSYGNTLDIFMDPKVLRKRIMGIVTDSTPLEAPKETEGSTILLLYRLFASPAELEEMERQFCAGGVGYGHFKQQLFEAIREYFAPMRERREQLLARPGYVDEVLREGAARAHAVAGPVMERVRRAVGLR
jgi:tryptophanyl-tRNA synthetase